MSDYTAYGTMAGSTYTISLNPEKGTERARTPSGLIVTRAVQTKDGWRGQILVDKEIVYESEAIGDGDEAVIDANARVVKAIKNLFRDTTNDDEATND